KDIEVDGEKAGVADWLKDSWYLTLNGQPQLQQFERLLGRKYEPRKVIRGQYTMENSVMEMKDHSLIMRIMYKAVEKTIAKGCGGKIDYENPEFRMMMNASAGGPLRSMAISSGMKGGVFKGMLEMANGHFLKGLIIMIRGN
ncbi:MAG: hypothetical protein J5694_04150, partial [Erysipelotrichaceae bacterium]|nr:hypothetical protein [Erysipelotrichaceae bacterium]